MPLALSKKQMRAWAYKIGGMVFAVVFLAACEMYNPWDSSVSGEEPGDDGTTTFEAPVGGNIEALAIDAGFQLNLSDYNVASGDDVVLAIYSYSTSTNTASFQINASSSPSALAVSDRAEWSFGEFDDPQDQMDELMRGIESDLEPGLRAAVPVEDSKAMRLVKTGSSRQFKVLSSMSSANSYQTITATLRYQNAYFNFYVDSRNASSLTDDEIEEMGERFESVLPLEYSIFGEPSDVDDDGRFTVLFTQAVNALGASQGGVVTGFFYAVDLFPDYDSSNEMEIYYTFVPDPDGDYGAAISKSFAISNVYPGVLPHELQHMINFNQRYFVNGNVPEEAWLNEALSHLSEDLYTVDGNGQITGYGLENPSRVKSYLSDMPNICFTCGASLSQRGGSYLFLKYLTEQANLGNLPGASSGSEFLGKLLRSTNRGVENIVAAALGDDTDVMEFKDLLGLFALATYLSNTGLSDDNRFEFSGINLRGVANDNRGTYLNGPAIQVIQDLPFVDSIVGNSISVIQIPSDIIDAQGGIFDFLVSDSSDFGAYLIK